MFIGSHLRSRTSHPYKSVKPSSAHCYDRANTFSIGISKLESVYRMGIASSFLALKFSLVNIMRRISQVLSLTIPTQALGRGRMVKIESLRMKQEAQATGGVVKRPGKKADQRN